MNRPRDAFISCRKTYTALLNGLTYWRWLAAILSGGPIIYLFAFLLYNALHQTIYTTFIAGVAYTMFGLVIAAWLLAVISVFCLYPNMLTISVFVYKCLGHWALVSFIILLFYGFEQLPQELTAYLAAGIIPSTFLLLFCSDLLLAERNKMFAKIDAAAAAAATVAIAPASHVDNHFEAPAEHVSSTQTTPFAKP